MLLRAGRCRGGLGALATSATSHVGAAVRAVNGASGKRLIGGAGTLQPPGRVALVARALHARGVAAVGRISGLRAAFPAPRRTAAAARLHPAAAGRAPAIRWLTVRSGSDTGATAITKKGSLLWRVIPKSVRTLVAQYGVCFVGVYFALYWLTWGTIYLTLSSGMLDGAKMISHIKRGVAWASGKMPSLDLEHHLKLDKVNPDVSVLAVAWCVPSVPPSPCPRTSPPHGTC